MRHNFYDLGVSIFLIIIGIGLVFILEHVIYGAILVLGGITYNYELVFSLLRKVLNSFKEEGYSPSSSINSPIIEKSSGGIVGTVGRDLNLVINGAERKMYKKRKVTRKKNVGEKKSDHSAKR